VDYWGLKKNTTRTQRADIIKTLDEKEGVPGSSDSNPLRVGRIRLNDHKLGRWKKEVQSMKPWETVDEGRSMFENPSNGKHYNQKHHDVLGGDVRINIIEQIPGLNPWNGEIRVNQDMLYEEYNDPHEHYTVPAKDQSGIAELQEIPRFQVAIWEVDIREPSALARLNATFLDPEFTKTIYDAADIPGSPKLSRLFEAMKIDLQVQEMSLDDTPKLDKNDCISPVVLYNKAKQPTQSMDHEGRSGQGSKAVVPSRKRQRRLSFTNSYFERWLFRAVRNAANPLDEIDVFPNPRFVDLDEESSGSSSPPVPLPPLQQRRCESEDRIRKLTQLLPSDSKVIVKEMAKLAWICWALGQNSMCERLWQQVAASRAETLGPDHPDTLTAYLEIVVANINKSHYATASKLHHFLHSRIIDNIRSDDSLAIRSTDTMAIIEFNLGNYKQSEKRTRKLLQICLSKFGLQHISTWRTLISLAYDLLSRGEYSQCEHLYNTAEQLRHKIVTIPERDACVSMSHLAITLAEQGRYEESCSLARDALRKSKAVLGVDHPDTLDIGCELGTCLRYQGKLEESEEVLRDTIARSTSLRGSLHADTICSVYELARTLMECKRWKEVQVLLEQTFLSQAKMRGLAHPYTKDTIENLILCYKELGFDIEESGVDARLETLLDGLEMDRADEAEEVSDVDPQEGDAAEEARRPAKIYRRDE
jgi:tetratricopeptide (TPR) repeat protein